MRLSFTPRHPPSPARHGRESRSSRCGCAAPWQSHPTRIRTKAPASALTACVLCARMCFSWCSSWQNLHIITAWADDVACIQTDENCGIMLIILQLYYVVNAFFLIFVSRKRKMKIILQNLSAGEQNGIFLSFLLTAGKNHI